VGVDQVPPPGAKSAHAHAAPARGPKISSL
jgi:hypothetical protein